MLIPCRPAVYDLETVAATVDVIRAVAPDTPYLCILNGVPPRVPRQPQARRLLADLDVPVCTASLGLRAAVDYAAAVYDIVRHAAGLPASAHVHLSTSRQEHSSTGREVGLSSGRRPDRSARRNPHNDAGQVR